MYKVRDGARGRKLYFHNGKMISQKDVPEEVMAKLLFSDQIEETMIAPPEPDKVCIVCGEHGDKTRFVNLQTVVLCEEHYYSMTMGKIVQHMKEKV